MTGNLLNFLSASCSVSGKILRCSGESVKEKLSSFLKQPGSRKRRITGKKIVEKTYYRRKRRREREQRRKFL